MTNCDSTLLPHNETAIAVDPNDPNHLTAGSNDTQLPPSGAAGAAKSVAGYYTSFDGGATWLKDFGFSVDPGVREPEFLARYLESQIRRQDAERRLREWRLGWSASPGVIMRLETEAAKKTNPTCHPARL